VGYVLRQAAAAPWGAVRQRLQLIPPPEVLPDCLGQDVGGVRPLNGAALIHQDERGAHPAQCAWWACAMVPAPSGPWCMGGSVQGPPYAPEPSPTSPWRTVKTQTPHSLKMIEPLFSLSGPRPYCRKGSPGAGWGPCPGRGGAPGRRPGRAGLAPWWGRTDKIRKKVENRGEKRKAHW